MLRSHPQTHPDSPDHSAINIKSGLNPEVLVNALVRDKLLDIKIRENNKDALRAIIELAKKSLKKSSFEIFTQEEK